MISGRITTQMTTASVLSSINNVQDQLATTQQQLSTGLSINQPSDNPYGASLAIQLKNGLPGAQQLQLQHHRRHRVGLGGRHLAAPTS